MKLTPERARELQKSGVKVDWSKVVREKPEVKVDKVIKPEPAKDDTISIFAKLAKVNEENTANIIMINNNMVSVLQEMQKSKPKKKFISTVSRDQRGNINKVETHEV